MTIKDIPYVRSIMFVSRTAPVRYERAGPFGKIYTATGIVRGMSGYMAKHGAPLRELEKWQRRQNVLRRDMALSELWKHYTAFMPDGYSAEKAKGQAFLQDKIDAQIAIHEKNIRNAKEWREREVDDWDRSAKYFKIDETHRDDPRWASYYTHVDAKAARRLLQRAEGVKQYDDMIVTNEATLDKLRAGDHSLLVGADHLLTTLERVMGEARETLTEYGGVDADELSEALEDAELIDMDDKATASQEPDAPPEAVPAPSPVPVPIPAPVARDEAAEMPLATGLGTAAVEDPGTASGRVAEMPQMAGTRSVLGLGSATRYRRVAEVEAKLNPVTPMPAVATSTSSPPKPQRYIGDQAITAKAETFVIEAERINTPIPVAEPPATAPPAPTPSNDVLDLTGIDLRMDRKHLRPVDWHDPSVRTFDVWVRPNGTGKVRAFSSKNLDGVVVDFGDVEVPLKQGRKGFYFANLSVEQVAEIQP